MGLSITPVGVCRFVCADRHLFDKRRPWWGGSGVGWEEVRGRKRYDQMRLAWNTSYILGSEADNPVEWRPGCPHRL